MNSSYTQIAIDGLWKNNPGLVQILGLCPLLAVSSNFINGLSLGLATTLVLTGTNIAVSLIRNVIKPELRIPIFVLVIASLVTAIELAMNAYLHELYLVLGIFIPLIVTNCVVIGRAEAFASKNTVFHSTLDGFTMGLGFTAVLVALGGLRELLGHGTLFAHAAAMFGPAFKDMEFSLGPDYHGVLLAILPPGAFFALGFLIAAKNVIDARRAARRRTAPVTAPVVTASPASA